MSRNDVLAIKILHQMAEMEKTLRIMGEHIDVVADLIDKSCRNFEKQKRSDEEKEKSNSDNQSHGKQREDPKTEFFEDHLEEEGKIRVEE